MKTHGSPWVDWWKPIQIMAKTNLNIIPNIKNMETKNKIKKYAK